MTTRKAPAAPPTCKSCNRLMKRGMEYEFEGIQWLWWNCDYCKFSTAQRTPV